MSGIFTHPSRGLLGGGIITRGLHFGGKDLGALRRGKAQALLE
jgi:hypothetical protein